MKTKLNINSLIFIASVISGIALSLFSLNYSRVVISQPVDLCVGTTFGECDSLPLKVVAGYPLEIQTSTYTYVLDGGIVINSVPINESEMSYSFVNMILNLFILISSSFLLLISLLLFYRNISNKLIRKSLDNIINLTSILLPLFTSVVLFFEINKIVSNAIGIGSEYTDTTLAAYAFIVWILPIIFTYDIYQLTRMHKKLIPIISIALIVVSWFYIIGGGLLF